MYSLGGEVAFFHSRELGPAFDLGVQYPAST